MKRQPLDSPPDLTSAVLASVPPALLDGHLQRVAIYPFFTLALGQRAGLAMTLVGGSSVADQPEREVRHCGAVHERPLRELLAWTASDHPLERSIGVAALNASLPTDGLALHDGNAIELAVRLGAGKDVVVVGHFPRLEALRASARSLAILEKKPLPGDLPAEAAPDVIPGAGLVAITGVTFLNDTLSGLLALKRPGATFIVLGPTVPLSPVLFEHGVDVIGGSVVEDVARVEGMLAHGGMPRRGHGLRHVLVAQDQRLLGP